MKIEDPSKFWGALVGVVGATTGLLVAFGVDLTEDQIKAVLTFFGAVGPIVTALLISRQAFKPSTVVEIKEKAVNAALSPRVRPLEEQTNLPFDL